MHMYIHTYIHTYILYLSWLEKNQRHEEGVHKRNDTICSWKHGARTGDGQDNPGRRSRKLSLTVKQVPLEEAELF